MNEVTDKKWSKEKTRSWLESQLEKRSDSAKQALGFQISRSLGTSLDPNAQTDIDMVVDYIIDAAVAKLRLWLLENEGGNDD